MSFADPRPRTSAQMRVLARYLSQTAEQAGHLDAKRRKKEQNTEATDRGDVGCQEIFTKGTCGSGH